MTKIPEVFEDIVREELNVKTLKAGKAVALDTKLTPELRREGMMREVVRHIQSARKNAGLNVDDRINLWLVTEDADLKKAIVEYTETIKSETLTKAIKEVENNRSSVKVDGIDLEISLQKAS